MDPRITSWMNKSRNKFLFKQRQKEIIKLMRLKILKYVARDTDKSVFYCFISDNVTDSANIEEFIICFS